MPLQEAYSLPGKLLLQVTEISAPLLLYGHGRTAHLARIELEAALPAQLLGQKLWVHWLWPVHWQHSSLCSGQASSVGKLQTSPKRYAVSREGPVPSLLLGHHDAAHLACIGLNTGLTAQLLRQ